MDSDHDGVNDALDKFPKDASETVDTDLDGIGNNKDKDDDNDGALDGAWPGAAPQRSLSCRLETGDVGLRAPFGRQRCLGASPTLRGSAA